MDPRPGDALLWPVTPQSPFVSKVVAAAEMFRGMGRGEVNYSHVAAISEHDLWDYESRWPRAGLYPIDYTRIVEVWRIGDPTLAQTRAALNWWNAHQGDRYNMLGLVTLGFMGLPHQEVCSQFYVDGWAHGGLKFDREGQRIISPNAIADHSEARLIARYVPGVGRVL